MSSIQLSLLVFLGGGLGSVARFWIGQLLPGAWPWGTFSVNILGAALIGILGAVMSSAAPAEPWRYYLFIGFLGGFTTFSSFSLEAVRMAQRQEWGSAALYVVSTNVLCLLSCAAAWWLTHKRLEAVLGS